MKIASANLEMSSSHLATQHESVRESIRTWDGNQPRPTPDTNNRSVPGNGVTISEAGMTALASETLDNTERSGAQNSLNEIQDSIENDPRMILIRSMIEALTGRKIRIFDQSTLSLKENQTVSLQSNPSARPAEGATSGAGAEYNYHYAYSESEQTSFAASGVVKTADGQTIKFDLQLAMSRSYSEESNINVQIGAPEAKKKDPLVINFGGTAAQLTDTRFEFDLDADGTAENINFVRPGSGFLVFDKNQDGKANDGSELFGPKTGNGFNELAALDDDRNGWIDENDAAYQNLRVWTKDAKGEDQLLTLQEANVGAIALAHVATPFDLKDKNNQLQGQIRSSGIYLQENGNVGSVQQIDLTV